MKPPLIYFGMIILRLSLAAVFLAHAALKLLVFGLTGTAAFFAAHGIPGWTAYPVFAIEVIGALCLTLGKAVRPISIVLACTMIGAVYVHAPNGWAFTASGGGWEYPAFLLFILIVQALLGS